MRFRRSHASAARRAIRKAKPFALLVVVLLLVGCGHRGGELTAPVEGWRSSTPEEQGIDSRPLLAMLQEIQEQDLRIDGVIVVRNGYLVMEAYFPPYTGEHRHIIYSATKGISALLAGLAIEDGLILDEKVKVLDLLPMKGEEIENLDDWKRQLALEDLLTMTDGFEWQDWPYGIRAEGDFSRLLASSDGVRYILDKPIVQEPGTHFNYNSGASHLLTAIVQEVTGETALEYANARLFQPLGIHDAGWSAYQGINNGGSELFLRPREMAKVGFLMLNEGRWEGQQILPADWVEASLQQYIKTDVEFIEEEYGYQWYTKTFAGHKVHSAEGLGGNFTFIVPDLELVVAFAGGLMGREMAAPYRFLEESVIPAVKSDTPLPPNPAYIQTLNTLAAGLPATAQELPEFARQVSGSTFEVRDEENVLGIEQLSITFPQGNEARMKIVYSGTGVDADWGMDIVFRRDDVLEEERELQMAIGLDGRFRTVIVDHDEVGKVPFSAKGRWQDDRTLVLTVLSAWAIPETWTLEFDDDDSATLVIETPFLQTEVFLH
jgi:CubicO group peptidase (beta-lactamase class C family)